MVRWQPPSCSLCFLDGGTVPAYARSVSCRMGLVVYRKGNSNLKITASLVRGYDALSLPSAWWHTFLGTTVLLVLIEPWSVFGRLTTTFCLPVISCGLCEETCKVGVIDAERKQVNNGNCIACFNGLPVCHHKAIWYTFSTKEATK